MNKQVIKVVNDNIDSNNACDIFRVAEYFKVTPFVAMNRGKLLGLFKL